MRTKQELAHLLASDYANPAIDQKTVTEAAKQVNKLLPKILKAKSDQFNFATVDLPEGTARVGIMIEKGKNTETHINSPTFDSRNGILISNDQIYAYIQALKPSQRRGGEKYSIGVIVHQ